MLKSRLAPAHFVSLIHSHESYIHLMSQLLVTLIAAAIILSFTSLEFLDYRKVFTETSIVVDKSRGEKLTVNLNVTFPRVPCFCK